MTASSRLQTAANSRTLNRIQVREAKHRQHGCDEDALKKAGKEQTMEVARFDMTQVEALSEMLARAFFHDPMMTFILPEAGARKGALPWLLRSGANAGGLFGEVYATPGQAGAAVWLAPGQHHLTEDKFARCGFAEAFARMSPDATERFQQVMGHLGAVHDRDVREPHWYLLILGVDPVCQGNGMGSALIQPILQRAAEARLPCFLNTFNPDNVPFYKRHGFQVVREEDIPGGGLRFWNMRT
jgi:ribosomal protein S18 acetylase RimI-like enzyme